MVTEEVVAVKRKAGTNAPILLPRASERTRELRLYENLDYVGGRRKNFTLKL